MSAPAITVEGLAKRYELGSRSGSLAEQLSVRTRRLLGRHTPDTDDRDTEFWALRDVSLEIQPGEVVGLIGSNGAGKSTLMKLLANITYPTEGRIEMRGRVGTLLEVGTGFHPELSGRENVYLSGTILGMRRREIRQRYDEIVEFSGIERFIETPVKRYSSGMYVRLGFAVAAHLSPEILLVDEVLAVGDADFQKKCLAKMREVVDDGRTIVFVSHNLNSVQRLCERSYWIDRGGVAATGPTDQVIASYLTHVGGKDQRGGIAVISPSAERVGTSEILIERIELIGSEGAPVDVLRIGEPFKVRISVDVKREISDGLAELGISSADGTRVVTSFSTDGGRPIERMSIGKAALSVQPDVTLLPGDFTIDVGVHHADGGATIDLADQALTFRVVNVGHAASDRWPSLAVRGSVRTPASWTASTRSE